MTTPTVRAPEEILEFWLGDRECRSYAPKEWSTRWWTKDAVFDAQIRERFGATYDAVVAGACDPWLHDPKTRVAYVIVLDQFSRNMFRDTPKMYAADHLAIAASLAAVETGDDQKVDGDARVFLYMPLMHAEDVKLQDRCVALFETLAQTCPAEVRERIVSNHKYAIAHRDIVARFGRFPHRNKILGRPSTAEEQAFLAQPGSSF